MDTKLLEKKMESISPFELKNRLIDLADESLKKTARSGFADYVSPLVRR